MASNVQVSTAMRSEYLDNGIGTTFDGGVLEIRNGTQPANADQAPVGTILAQITVPTPSFASAISGTKAKAGTWEDAAADANGTPTWFRLRTSSDSGTTNTTDKRIDGSAGLLGGVGFDLEVAAAMELGEKFRITQFNITQPAAAP